MVSYFVRSLPSEGRLRYETVVKTKDGLKPRLIEREGRPVYWVTTTAIAEMLRLMNKLGPEEPSCVPLLNCRERW